MKTWTPTLSIAALLLPLVAADCEKFEFRGQFGGDGFTTTHNQSMPVSSWTNCTAELASRNGNSNGGRNGTCEFHRYNMGLVVHPEIRFINFDSETSEHIFELVRENANPTASSLTDFNATIVMNYTAVHTDIALGDAGYYAFTPNIRCFDGVLSDCDDDDDDPEDINVGKLIRACGLSWINEDQSRLSTGHQLYSGDEGFVQTSSPAEIREEPQPSYDSVANQATVSEDNSSARSRASSATLLIALIGCAYNFI
ncbi:hypothetical protein GL218_01809 [Daldinia childiae]|uniref:uncharacterized protein n=1 Tax=Daldinia childiae TaxID=326645 RepID=UPI001446F189|nr:uncharacterized protein GL218_01809 [Daldinia childiae]KAF3063550.1 hypothetical protein GL218_01809 [Daldinia childiae]